MSAGAAAKSDTEPGATSAGGPADGDAEADTVAGTGADEGGGAAIQLDDEAEAPAATTISLSPARFPRYDSSLDFEIRFGSCATSAEMGLSPTHKHCPRPELASSRRKSSLLGMLKSMPWTCF